MVIIEKFQRENSIRVSVIKRIGFIKAFYLLFGGFIIKRDIAFVISYDELLLSITISET